MRILHVIGEKRERGRQKIPNTKSKKFSFSLSAPQKTFMFHVAFIRFVFETPFIPARESYREYTVKQ